MRNAKPSRPVQAELPLLEDPRRVAARRREEGSKPRFRHRSREGFPGAHPCLVTLKVRAGLPSLRRSGVVREVEDAFRRGRARASRERFRLAHYSIQGNHLHAIVEAEGTDALVRPYHPTKGTSPPDRPSHLASGNRALGRPWRRGDGRAAARPF